MLETSARLLRLLALLQSRPDWPGPVLAERLGVTTRTIRNDVERLRRLGYPIDATLGVAGGYRLAAGAAMPPLLLDDEEAVAIAVSLRIAAGAAIVGIEDAALRALVKLQQLLPSRLRHRVESLDAFDIPTGLATAAVDPTTLTALAAASRDRVGVRFDYRKHDGAAGRREVEPHRLVLVRRRWYLVAWDSASEHWRTFRIDRIDLPPNHRGRRFEARPLPDDLASRVRDDAERATWACRARVRASAPAATMAARLPSAIRVEPIDANTCVLELGSDSPELLAAYMAMLRVDMVVESASAPEALSEALRSVADRCGRAAVSSAGARPTSGSSA